jgi:hypothetical protein
MFPSPGVYNASAASYDQHSTPRPIPWYGGGGAQHPHNYAPTRPQAPAFSQAAHSYNDSPRTGFPAPSKVTKHSSTVLATSSASQSSSNNRSDVNATHYTFPQHFTSCMTSVAAAGTSVAPITIDDAPGSLSPQAAYIAAAEADNGQHPARVRPTPVRTHPAVSTMSVEESHTSPRGAIPAIDPSAMPCAAFALAPDTPKSVFTYSELMATVSAC